MQLGEPRPAEAMTSYLGERPGQRAPKKLPSPARVDPGKIQLKELTDHV
jgi:hypothetical protein